MAQEQAVGKTGPGSAITRFLSTTKHPALKTPPTFCQAAPEPPGLQSVLQAVFIGRMVEELDTISRTLVVAGFVARLPQRS